MHREIYVLIALLMLVPAGCSKGESTDGLIDDLSSKDEGVRVEAVRLLPQRKGDAAKVVPALTQMLSDKDVRVRISAAIGLGNFGDQAESALPELEKAKADKDRRVRDAVGTAISRIGGKE